MLIITPPFFEPLIVDALQQHFTSFSTVYMHTSSPPSPSPTTSPTLGPGSPEGLKQLEDSLYSWVPLKSIKRVIVVFCNLDNAERACQASDRYYFPPTPVHTRNHPACFPWCAYSISPHPVKRASPQIGFTTSTRTTRARSSSLRPPISGRSFLISLPGSPPVGWEQTHEGPPQRGAPR